MIKFRKIIPLLISLILVISFGDIVFSEEKKKNEKIIESDELVKLQLKKKELNVKLQSAEKQEKGYRKELENINRDISFLQGKMEKTRKEIELISKKIDQMKDRIVRAQQLQELEMTAFKNRLREMYKRRKLNYLNALFDAQEISSFLKRMQLLKRILNQDVQTVRKLKSAIKAVTITQKTFEDKKDELRTLLKDQNQSKIEMDRKERHKKKLLKALKHKKGIWQKRSTEYDKEIENLITELVKKQKEEQKKKAQERKKPVVEKKIEKLVWPAGDISQVFNKFGTVKDDEFGSSRFNAGIDIKLQEDDKIASAASGVVLYKGTMRGYGKLVIIDHGGNIVTVYAGLKTIEVRINQQLKEGELVGKGSDEGLHFEVRKSSVSVDPLGFLM